MLEPNAVARPPRRERRDARANRRRLLDAARAALVEHGATVSVNQIARAAGVGVGTLYRKYPTKADLLLALLLEIHTELSAAIAARTADAADVRAELRGLIEAHLEVMGRIGPIDSLLRREAPGLVAVVGPEELSDRFITPVRAVLERGVAAGAFATDLDLELVGRAFFGMLDSTVLAGLVEREGVGPVAARMTRVLVDGIGARG
jgi:AcrR family transcriptional regulator